MNRSGQQIRNVAKFNFRLWQYSLTIKLVFNAYIYKKKKIKKRRKPTLIHFISDDKRNANTDFNLLHLGRRKKREMKQRKEKRKKKLY